jgi:allophanate hydrolase subunit 2
MLGVSAPSSGQPKTLASSPSSLENGVLRLLPGPAASLGFKSVLGVTCKVRLDSDRVGVRLEGPKLEQPPERTSEPTIPGALQVTRDGSLIILGPDGPTIGGYPVIGYVVAADLSKVGQLRPGSSVSFSAVDTAESAGAWQEHIKGLDGTIALLRIGN